MAGEGEGDKTDNDLQIAARRLKAIRARLLAEKKNAKKDE
jgi:hypothetical protein